MSEHVVFGPSGEGALETELKCERDGMHGLHYRNYRKKLQNGKDEITCIIWVF